MLIAYANMRIQNILFTVLFLAAIGLVAGLSLRYSVAVDLTQSQRNSVNEVTANTLDVLTQPITIRAFFSSENIPAKQQITYLLDAYQRHKKDITVEFINIETQPTLAREWGAEVDGELIVELAGHSEHISPPVNEQVLTTALYRLARNEERWVIFIEGHDERSLYGNASFDYQNVQRMLENKGMQVRSLNLTTTPQIPDNVALIVLADPRRDFLAAELTVLRRYLQNQGNFLWLADVGMAKLDWLAEDLGIELLPGIIVDPDAEQLGDPRFTVIPDYPKHRITDGLRANTLFAAARGLEFIGDEYWHTKTLLETLPRTWAETNEAGPISLDTRDDIAGPLILGMALTRSMAEDTVAEQSDASTQVLIKKSPQRAVIIGDADFLADAYLGVVGNMEFTLKLFNWLVHDDELIDIPASHHTNKRLSLSEQWQFIIGVGALFVIPGGLFGIGMSIWIIRKRR